MIRDDKKDTGLATTLLALFVAGILYNELIADLEKTGKDRGYRGLLVTPVVFFAIAAISPFTGKEAALRTLAAILAVGAVPMAGDSWRYIQERHGNTENLYQALEEVLAYGDTP